MSTLEPIQEERMSIGSWFLTIFLAIIPVVGLVCYCLWLFGVGNKNRANGCRALLIFLLSFTALAVGAYFLLDLAFGVNLVAEVSNLFNSGVEWARGILGL